RFPAVRGYRPIILIRIGPWGSRQSRERRDTFQWVNCVNIARNDPRRLRHEFSQFLLIPAAFWLTCPGRSHISQLVKETNCAPSRIYVQPSLSARQRTKKLRGFAIVIL